MMTMKKLLLVAILTGALAAAAEAQQSGKAVAVDGGPPPTTDYLWVTINGGGANADSVAIRHTDGTPVLNFLGGPVFVTGSFNRPYDIVGSPLRRRVFVSNGNASPGTVTAVDADTLQVLRVIPVPGSINLRGMSLSEDESKVYVAGQETTVGLEGPSVYEIDTATLANATRTGGILEVGRGADDCVVIRAANAGGSGDGPGKVYFSVNKPATTGYIGVINLLASGAVSSIATGQGGLLEVESASNMERTHDHRFVFVGCTKRLGFGPPPPPSPVRIIRIDTSNDSATAPQLTTGIQDLAHRVYDVTWTVDAGGNNRGLALVSVDNAFPPSIYEIFDTGLPRPGGPYASGTGGLSAPATIRYVARSSQVFVGERLGTSNAFNIFAGADPLTPPPTTRLGVGSDPLNFAVMPTSAVIVSDITPRAGFSGAPGPALVTVRGAGFVPGAFYNYGAGNLVAQFVDSNTLIVDLSAAPTSTLITVTVTNPNFQSKSIAPFFSRYTPETRTSFSLTLPSASQGYQMVSLPQYASLTSLKAGFSSALGPYNPVLYRVFFYRGGKYVELNSMADDGCDLAGESFWVLTRNGAVVNFSEPDVRACDAGVNRVIPLNTGFSMISVPQLDGLGGTGSIPVTSVLVGTDPTNFATAVAFPGTAMNPNVFERVGGSYVAVTTLDSGKGYWMENQGTVPAYLVFRPTFITKPGPPTGSTAAAAVGGSQPPPPPGASLTGSESSSGCGFLGLEALLAALFLRRRARRRLPA
jgi:hypothetical protein